MYNTFIHTSSNMYIRNISKISMFLAILLMFFWWWETFAEDIVNFSEYQKESKTVNIENISKTRAIQEITQAKNMICEYAREKKDMYIVSPSCLIKNDLPKIPFKDAIDYLWPYIDSFNMIYNDTNQVFSYQWTSPIFKKEYEILPKTLEEKLTLIRLQNKWKTIRIHKSSLAYQTIKKANFYTVYKDTSILKRCTKQNYTIALNKINGKIMEKGETLNLNKEIMNLKWYCKWAGAQDLLFYGGVCGFATQLFRTSLLVPTIEITKRYAHSERLVPYYSDYIFGDDAALYQMNKQLEIKNIGDTQVYLKVLDKWNATYFVMMIPEKLNQWVTITKKETGWLTAEVKREIYQGNTDMIIKKDVFKSTYIKKVYTRR